jgi:hypothetical protein
MSCSHQGPHFLVRHLTLFHISQPIEVTYTNNASILFIHMKEGKLSVLYKHVKFKLSLS